MWYNLLVPALPGGFGVLVLSVASKETFVDLTTALNIVQIIISVVLIVVVLLQAKGSGFSGMFGGDSSSIYRTRRGFERRLYQFTIGLSVVFVFVSLFSSVIGRR
jgi:preprotein translocase subunit SecG